MGQQVIVVAALLCIARMSAGIGERSIATPTPIPTTTTLFATTPATTTKLTIVTTTTTTPMTTTSSSSSSTSNKAITTAATTVASTTSPSTAAASTTASAVSSSTPTTTTLAPTTTTAATTAASTAASTPSSAPTTASTPASSSSAPSTAASSATSASTTARATTAAASSTSPSTAANTAASTAASTASTAASSTTASTSAPSTTAPVFSTSTTSTTSMTPTETATTMIPTTPSSCKAFRNCYRCVPQNESLCAQCSNSFFLLDGKCVASCPETHLAEGGGRFNRFCVAKASIPNCTALVADCYSCNADRSACKVCTHQKFLLDGMCVDRCPAGYSGKGVGQFNRFCALNPDGVTPGSCRTLQNRCYACDDTLTRCLMCSNGAVLFNGVCIDRSACPAGHQVKGSGNFRQLCVPNEIVASPTCASSHCRVCRSPAACDDCVPPYVVQNGACARSCSSGFISVPGFGLSHVCVATPPSPAGGCSVGNNNCLTCNSLGKCTKCSPSTNLFACVCVASCPASTVAADTASGKQCL